MTGQTDDGPSLRDSISAAMDSTPAATTAPAASQDTANTPTTGATPTTESTPTTEPIAATTTEAAPAPAGGEKMKPPVGWHDVREWEAMPDASRKWIREREANMNRFAQQTAGVRKFGQALSQAMQPYEPMLRQLGINPVEAVSESLQLVYALSNGTPDQRLQAFAAAAQHYGVDIGRLANGDVPQQRQLPPEVAQLQAKLDAMEAHFMGQQQQVSQQEAQQKWQAIDQFWNSPEHEHIHLVYEDMAQLLDSGRYGENPSPEALKRAYDDALYLRPDLRALMAEKEAARRAKMAAAARSSSTGGSGSPVAANTEPSDQSLRGTIERAWGAAA